MPIQSLDNDKYVLEVSIPGKVPFMPWLTLKRSKLVDAGTGLFAEQSFPKGSAIAVFLGEASDDMEAPSSHYGLMSDSEVRDPKGGLGTANPIYFGAHLINDPHNYRYSMPPPSKMAKVVKRRKDEQDLIKSQNLPEVNSEFTGGFLLMTTRGVQAGEELYLDYKREGHEEKEDTK